VRHGSCRRWSHSSAWRRRSPRYRAGAAARDAFLAALNRTASQKRIKALMERGFHRPGDVENRVENRLGFYVGQIGD
jgi:hypothetical protein